ncbi:MAG: T9SS type A sorting domain-containing protein [Ignavibacteriaceae bacterium]|nr:T9SS type A sorting domain-containing protein [Ignavibacteriaceae bacterium]
MIKFYTLFSILLLSITTIYSQHPLPTETTPLFRGSGNCVLCHESDGNAMTWNGVDVSPISYWRSTMMGNASKDPLWRAMVAEEVHNFPQLQETIETTCLRCHSPMGYTEAFFNGDTTYSMAQMKSDPVANDGVSCTACHQIKENNFGTQQSYSGHYLIEADSIIYGPYENSDTTHMPFWPGVQYNVEYGPHMNKSELCATCHTLFTPYLDNSGNIAGTFPEQTPYLEWKNSNYPSQDIQCQDCHLPNVDDPILISSRGNYPERTPFWRHAFVGGNVYMLKILKANIDSVGATAEPEHFDSTISRAEYNLTESSVVLSTFSDFQNDTLEIRVIVENLTGHKLPTGIPFRRMWIHLKVEEVGGTVIFESGEWDSEGKVADYNSDYEPHYDFISSDDEVQAYEGVFIDVDQNVTYALLRAAEYIKDNRIPPAGFTTAHNSYDSTGIFGNAVIDPNFNKDGGNEGSGMDIVTYKIPGEQSKTYRVTAEVCYQSIKPELVDHLRVISEPDITKFVDMYDGIPNVPFIMESVMFDIVTGVETEPGLVAEFKLEQNYPNPFNPNTVISWQSPTSGWQTLKIYDVIGNEILTLVNKYLSTGKYSIEFDASQLPSGIYYYKLDADKYSETKKMVLIK